MWNLFLKGSDDMPNTIVNRSNTSLSDKDFNLLAKLTEAEAGGEGYEGKVAVAASVLNRVKSGDYPKTVRNVIFDKGQYSPVDDERLYNVNPNQETINACPRCTKWSRSYQRCNRVLESNQISG